jgi:Tol biopolymer transport system component
LAREAAYEDEQSRAGNVNAVMALHAFGNEAWQRRRAAEVAAGLAAPQPAASLLPVDTPPELVAVDAFGDRLYTATLVREYVDSAGQVYRFRFTQRYFNNAPGLWQRLPPDEARLAETSVWTGRRMSVSFPVADEAWMVRALPEIDAYLEQACADWACPTELSLPILFSGELGEMTPPLPPTRPAEYSGGYPIIFDTTFRAPRYPRLVILTSPQLAGVPHDEAASQALVRAITSDLLGQLAAETAGTNRAQFAYFLDVLVARAEARLGLSATPAYQPTLAEYVPVTALWRDVVGNGGGPRPAVAPRLAGLWFLNEILGERLPTADAGLLATVREAPDLVTWLEGGAQIDGEAAIEQWEAAMTSQLAAAAPADWRLLQGLAYTCAGNAWLVAARGPQLLPQETGQSWLGPLSVSPDGLKIAAPTVLSDTNQLRLVDVLGMTTTVVVPHTAYPLGWAATGDLVVVDQTPAEDGRMVNRLRVYNVTTGGFTPVTGMELAERSADPVWSANRQTLAFTLTDAVGSRTSRTVPAIVAFDDPFSMVVAAWQGISPALSPDGRWLAYITTQAADSLTIAPTEARIEVLDLETNNIYPVLTLAELFNSRPVDQFTGLSWSPDGTRLAAIASLGNFDFLYALALETGTPNVIKSVSEVAVPIADFELVGFSADSQFLAVSNSASTTRRLMVLDLEGAEAPVFAANADAAAWSPGGHRLAIANAAGLYVAEPDTGVVQWVTDGNCTPSWHPLH